MKRLDTPYDGKYYKFAFKNIETQQWFLANKKPKDIHVKKGYWGSILDDHYQYHIKTLMYDTGIKCKKMSGTTKVYNEYEFVCGMLVRSKNNIKEAREYCKEMPDNNQWKERLSESKLEKKFFENRKKEIETSPEYLWETLKA